MISLLRDLHAIMSSEWKELVIANEGGKKWKIGREGWVNGVKQ